MDKAFPEDKSYNYVWNYFYSKGITAEKIASIAYDIQHHHTKDANLMDYTRAVFEVTNKWDVLQCCMVGINLDKKATAKELDEPLQSILDNDLGVFAVDEVLAYYGFATLYGGIGITSAGWLDKEKTGIIKKIDEDRNSVNVFLDDLVVGIVSCVSAKIAHDYTKVE